MISGTVTHIFVILVFKGEKQENFSKSEASLGYIRLYLKEGEKRPEEFMNLSSNHPEYGCLACGLISSYKHIWQEL